MSTEFNLTSRYYDLLYRDKDYAAEAGYVESLLKTHCPDGSTVLEIGSGTGIHASFLAKSGYRVTGVERSDDMHQQALHRADELNRSEDLAGTFTSIHSDGQSFTSEQRFDAAISLFHVVSYQTTNDSMHAFFANVAKHLREGGVFVFDVWYGPAVLTEQPSVRIKRVSDAGLSVTRIAEPTWFPEQNVVQVDYQIFVQSTSVDSPTSIGDGAKAISTLQESHRMRYFFSPEIEMLAAAHSMRVEHAEQWQTKKPLDGSTWGACFILRKLTDCQSP